MTAVRRHVRMGLVFAIVMLAYACSNARISGEAWCPFRVCVISHTPEFIAHRERRDAGLERLRHEASHR